MCHSALPHYLQEPFTDFGSGMEDQNEVGVMGVCNKTFGMSCAGQLELTFFMISQQWSESKADVQKALEHFERSGKVHPSILQASIFRKPYFVGRFLPTLLMPTPVSSGIALFIVSVCPHSFPSVTKD